VFQTEFNLKDYLVHLENLVNIDSGSSTYAGLDRVAEYYATLYEEIDLHVKRFKPDHAPANCLEITNAPEADYYDILIVGHMDTVFTEGTVHERPFRIEGDYAYGPGVADMKAGLLSAYYIVKRLLQQDPSIKICIAQNSDEEISSPHSQEWLTALAKMSKCALVFECSRMQPYGALVNRRKGVAKVIVDFNGKAAHAGSDPENGASAIHELGYFMNELLKYQDPARGFTINFGKITGGSATNVVAAKAQCHIDFRFATMEDYHQIYKILDQLTQNSFVKNVTISYHISASRPPMVPNEKALELSQIILNTARDLAYPIEFILPGGGSDGSFTAAAGCPTIDCCGSIGGGEHGVDEFLYLPNIVENYRLWIEAIPKLLQNLG